MDASSRPTIPLRGSSKNALQKRKKKLEAEHDKLTDKIAAEQWKIKRRGSFDMNWWMRMSANESEKAELHTLKRKISMAENNYDDQDEAAVRKYGETPEGRRHIMDEEAVKKTAELMKQHQERLISEGTDVAKIKRSVFVKMFMSSRSERNFNTIDGERPPSAQIQFRQELQREMGRHKNSRTVAYWWCPVTRGYTHYKCMVAAHLFSSRCGQEAMSAIFGEAELDMYVDPQHAPRPEPKGELFRAVNGIFWSSDAEKRFTAGLFVIVPDLNTDATATEIATWEASNPKEYRLRVIDSNHHDMNQHISPQIKQPWHSIDGNRLLFNDPEKLKRKATDPDFEYEIVNFRPRARYVYWTYIETVLREVYRAPIGKKDQLVNQIAKDLSKREVGKPYWGSHGAYVKKNYLAGFLEVVGHEYDELMENAMAPGEGEDVEADPMVVGVMNRGILEKNKAAERRGNGVRVQSEVTEDEMSSDDDDEVGEMREW